MARSFGRSTGSMTTAKVMTNVTTFRTASQHETASMTCTPTATLYRLAFLKPALGKPCQMTVGNKPVDRGVRLGGVRRKPRLRVGARPLDTAQHRSTGWAFNGSRREAIGISIRRYASIMLRVCDPSFVTQHSWLPLICYVKRVKRYKAKERKTVPKERLITYASHRDACILSRYAYEITCLLDDCYEKENLVKNVIAYRRLGRSNYDFSADAYRFAKAHSPCVVLCFDITGFFDNLDHSILKSRLKRFLGATELPGDWYAVFRRVTKFSWVERAALEAHPTFSARMAEDSREPIATISEILDAGMPIETNPNKFGIPQGTPISSAFSNLYMVEVDKAMVDACARFGGLYQRYSDDILVICPLDKEAEITAKIKAVIATHKLEVKDEKTERAMFGPGSDEIFQYLGFNVSPNGATIRPASLARQWRKAKRSIATTRRHGEAAIARGQATKIFTKRLRRRFQPVGVRNFSKYARRSAQAFGSRQIVRQVLRLERMVDQAIRELDK
jgi:RNA-directed DNA polymerase